MIVLIYPCPRQRIYLLSNTLLEQRFTPYNPKFRCVIEEYAVNTLVSLDNLAKSPPKIHPIAAIIIIGTREILFNTTTFNTPKTPTFNNNPASNILQLVGASTCALGNQWCIINKGLFTKKRPKL
jgi:hypothetical protein